MRRSRRLAFGTTVGVAGSSSAMPLASLTPQTMVVSSPTGAPARLQRSSGTNRSGVVTGGASWCGGEPARSGAAACCLDLETAAVGTVPSILLLWRNSGLRRRCRSATRTLRLSWPGLCSFGRISDSAMLSAAMCSGPVASRQSRKPASQAKAAGCRAIGATVVLLSGRTKTTTERDVLWTRGTTRRATDDA
jgi:hypothetical protein